MCAYVFMCLCALVYTIPAIYYIYACQTYACRWLENHKISSSYVDQSGFEHLYNSQLSAKEKQKVAIVRPDALNSEAPAMGRQAAHNQVLHLAAEGMDMRRSSFAAGAEEVCGALEKRRAPRHQLKMTRKALRNIAEKR
jgi:hypothetical protein